MIKWSVSSTAGGVASVAQLAREPEIVSGRNGAVSKVLVRDPSTFTGRRTAWPGEAPPIVPAMVVPLTSRPSTSPTASDGAIASRAEVSHAWRSAYAPANNAMTLIGLLCRHYAVGPRGTAIGVAVGSIPVRRGLPAPVPPTRLALARARKGRTAP